MNTPVAKKVTRSKTMWFNATMATLAVLEMKTQILQPLLPPQSYAVFAVVVPIVNMVLRTMTSAPVTRK